MSETQNSIRKIINNSKFMTFSLICLLGILVAQSYKNIIFGVYAITVLALTTRKYYNIFKNGGHYSIFSEVVDQVTMIIPMVIIISLISGVVYLLFEIVLGDIIRSSQMTFLITVTVISLIFVYKYRFILGISVLVNMYVGSRVVGYFFGKNRWDEELIDRLKDEELVETTQFNDDSIEIKMKDENVSIQDHIDELEKEFVKYNIETNYS